MRSHPAEAMRLARERARGKPRAELRPFPWPEIWAAGGRWLALLPPLRQGVQELPGCPPWRGAVLARGEALARAVRHADRGAAVAAAAALGGLGEGSTPAGDDWLMGTLHAVWAADALARPWAGALAAAAAAGTTADSGAWLRAAAAGAVGERWRELLSALAACDERATGAAASAVRGLGHTSGAYSLRGFLAILER